MLFSSRENYFPYIRKNDYLLDRVEDCKFAVVSTDPLQISDRRDSMRSNRHPASTFKQIRNESNTTNYTHLNDNTLNLHTYYVCIRQLASEIALARRIYVLTVYLPPFSCFLV